MSKILRIVTEAPTVLIGEKHHDARAEAEAENVLRQMFPAVGITTSPDGSRQIAIEEIYSIAEIHTRECEQARKDGYDSGYKEGYDEGLGKGLEEAKKVLGQFDQAIKDAVGQRSALLEEAKHRVLDLVLKISRKVTFDTIEADPEVTAEMINKVINRLIDKSRIKIKVHPDHLPLVEQSVDCFLAGSSAIKELSIEADSRVRFGGCFIETPTGDIDARVESQFDVIEDVIRAGEE